MGNGGGVMGDGGGVMGDGGGIMGSSLLSLFKCIHWH